MTDGLHSGVSNAVQQAHAHSTCHLEPARLPNPCIARWRCQPAGTPGQWFRIERIGEGHQHRHRGHDVAPAKCQRPDQRCRVASTGAGRLALPIWWRITRHWHGLQRAGAACVSAGVAARIATYVRRNQPRRRPCDRARTGARRPGLFRHPQPPVFPCRDLSGCGQIRPFAVGRVVGSGRQHATTVPAVLPTSPRWARRARVLALPAAGL